MNYLEDKIQKLYMTILHIERPDQLNIDYIASQLGIEVCYWEEASQALILHNTAYIFLKKSMNVWEDFCHELAHVLYHAGDQMLLHKLFVDYQEMRANSFALHAAVPSYLLLQMDLPSNYFAAVRVIQDTFNISLHFACTRLNHFINNHIHTLTNDQKTLKNAHIDMHKIC